MFIDEAKVFVRAGRGGNGLVAFRREKYVPRGGPSGGDGGHGGSVVFVVDPGLRTLLDLRYQQHLSAEPGENGGTKDRSGRTGGDLLVPVPPGTVVRESETGRIIADLTSGGQTAVIARGGRGGRGNARFSTSTERAPTFAEKGEPGQELTIRLELKLVADAGLLGMPNAGKSTFLSRVSSARPKIADYPFTTLAPSLGVVGVPGRDGASFVLADLPGLVEGAHQGSGLGHRFLRHIERTRVLVHLVDVSPGAAQSPVEAYRSVRRELALYEEDLSRRVEIVVATKLDLPGAAQGAEELANHLGREEPGPRFFRASAVTGEGLPAVLHAIADLLEEPSHKEMRDVGAAGDIEAEPPRAAGRRQKSFSIAYEGGVYVVSGVGIERDIIMTDLEHDTAVRRLHQRLRRRGVIKALRSAGASPGSTVRIGDFEFDFVE